MSAIWLRLTAVRNSNDPKKIVLLICSKLNGRRTSRAPIAVGHMSDSGEVDPKLHFINRSYFYACLQKWIKTEFSCHWKSEQNITTSNQPPSKHTCRRNRQTDRGKQKRIKLSYIFVIRGKCDVCIIFQSISFISCGVWRCELTPYWIVEQDCSINTLAVQ